MGPNRFNIGFQEIPTIASRIFHWFVQVGLTEEVCKALTFLLITGLRIKSSRVGDRPYAIMYYAMMVSMGFALVENVMYGYRYIDQNPQFIMLMRSITAVLAHMMFGLMMGYFFSLGLKEVRGYDSEQTVFNVWARTHKKLKRIILFSLALLIPSFFHGTYDLILSLGVGWDKVAEFLIIGLGITYLMSKNLINKH
jgi:RsiW-degrading membrane proteinase PrsW (M82 family)